VAGHGWVGQDCGNFMGMQGCREGRLLFSGLKWGAHEISCGVDSGAADPSGVGADLPSRGAVRRWRWPTAPFPLEKQIVKAPLNARIDKEMPASAPMEASATTLTRGADLPCAMRLLPWACTDGRRHSRTICIRTRRNCGPPHRNGVVGVSDDPVGGDVLEGRQRTGDRDTSFDTSAERDADVAGEPGSEECRAMPMPAGSDEADRDAFGFSGDRERNGRRRGRAVRDGAKRTIVPGWE